jgi:mRNA-degrading endonuclease RelE of RelBE toxin-antitoxin system/PHD/YefM family antitoxin component YafN of YafNO toxin-antitoxin module
MEKRLEILDLPENVRALVGECELTGRRTLFTRGGRPVATLVSHDEYLALRETVDIANDAPLRAQIDAGDDETRRGAMLLTEDLTGKRSAEDRLRIAESVERTWQLLSDEDRTAAGEALAVIDDDPIAGAPLFEPLRGLWSLRRDSLRIVYRIVAEARFVVIVALTKC